jgi:hypothetical protein
MGEGRDGHNGYNVKLLNEAPSNESGVVPPQSKSGTAAHWDSTPYLFSTAAAQHRPTSPSVRLFPPFMGAGGDGDCSPQRHREAEKNRKAILCRKNAQKLKKARKSACARLRPLTPACARLVGKIYFAGSRRRGGSARPTFFGGDAAPTYQIVGFGRLNTDKYA